MDILGYAGCDESRVTNHGVPTLQFYSLWNGSKSTVRQFYARVWMVDCGLTDIR